MGLESKMFAKCDVCPYAEQITVEYTHYSANDDGSFSSHMKMSRLSNGWTFGKEAYGPMILLCPRCKNDPKFGDKDDW